MELCSNGHREVCFASGCCPACEAMDDAAEATAKAEDLEKELEAAQDRVKEMEADIEENA